MSIAPRTWTAENTASFHTKRAEQRTKNGLPPFAALAHAADGALVFPGVFKEGRAPAGGLRDQGRARASKPWRTTTTPNSPRRVAGPELSTSAATGSARIGVRPSPLLTHSTSPHPQHEFRAPYADIPHWRRRVPRPRACVASLPMTGGDAEILFCDAYLRRAWALQRAWAVEPERDALVEAWVAAVWVGPAHALSGAAPTRSRPPFIAALHAGLASRTRSPLRHAARLMRRDHDLA
ncbi:hypothetical protein HYPSUDRAFT_209843 [Hypholoma sublateritium FD-334 SS-4]|uniref:Uncharacterized protein n=1 Tax=Hypholoma sublateritium (strain FD-334 SS-4) TaxID=945553 RepID=A0A0D2NX39_HYPSF|nr:hypothetical protein HYPSUDRAFT_209843 [Hypholoma sublateritium FD-334 SS-4]